MINQILDNANTISWAMLWGALILAIISLIYEGYKLRRLSDNGNRADRTKHNKSRN